MTRRFLCVLAAAAVSFTLTVVAQQPANLFSTAVFREIGPTGQGGRFVEIAVVESMPRVFYAATATGGLFKTENNGLNFAQVFEQQPVASIGAVAVSQSNPNVVYVGSGEGNNSRSSYWGDGVYVSTDAARTWTRAGLADSHHIGRIVVHPTDPNTAYVAALGHLYSDNEERGLYKTTDGGKSWTKSLAVKSEGKDIGVVDVAMDPKNPHLYAATRQSAPPWTFAEADRQRHPQEPTAGRHGRSCRRPADRLLGRIGLASRQAPGRSCNRQSQSASQDAALLKQNSRRFGAPERTGTALPLR